MAQLQIDRVDVRVSFIVAFQFIIIGIKNALITGIPYLYDVNGILNLLLVGIVCVLYVYSFVLLNSRRTYVGMTMTWYFVILSIIFTYLFYPQNITYWKEYELRFLVIILPSCYLISKLDTLEYFKKYMTNGSYLLTIAILIFAVAVYKIGHTIHGTYSNYSMSMANVAMLGIMWQLRAYLKENNKKAMVFAIIGLVVLVLYGSRNQLLAIVSYIIFHILGKSKHKIVGISIIAVCSFFVIFFFKDILLYVLGIFEYFGLNSRTISLIIEGGIDESTQIRLDTYEKLKHLISRNPFIGLGIAGDEANIDELAHSLFYSIWCTYGLVLGSILLFLIFVCCIRAYKLSNGIDHQIFTMYFCMVFPRGFTGGDIWGSAVFWFFIGICFMIFNKHNRMKNR